MFICACIKLISYQNQNFDLPWRGLSYSITSRKWPPLVSDHLGLTFLVVAYGRFDCIFFALNEERSFLSDLGEEKHKRTFKHFLRDFFVCLPRPQPRTIWSQTMCGPLTISPSGNANPRRTNSQQVVRLSQQFTGLVGRKSINSSERSSVFSTKHKLNFTFILVAILIGVHNNQALGCLMVESKLSCLRLKDTIRWQLLGCWTQSTISETRTELWDNYPQDLWATIPVNLPPTVNRHRASHRIHCRKYKWELLLYHLLV